MNSFQRGVEAHQKGQFLEAQRFYQEYLRRFPGDFNSLQLLGLTYSSLGDLDSAIDNFKRSLSINPEQAHVFNNLGVCQKKKLLLADAQASFLKSIDLQADYLDPHKNLIRLFLEAGIYKDAWSAIEKANANFPNHMAIVKLKADYYQGIEDYAQAINLFEGLLQANPQATLVKHSLALNLRMDGQSARALELYNQLEQEGMLNFQLFHNKANAMSDLGQLQNAIEYYRKAITENPAYVESHKNLSDLLWETNNKEDFLMSYLDAFKLVPDNLELRFSYASILLRLGEYARAKEFLEPLSQIAQEHFEYFDLLGRGYKKLGNIKVALEMQRRACQFENVPVSVLINFAETLIEVESYIEAQEVLNNVLQQQPDNKHGWALLGIVWKMLGDPRSEVLNDYDQLVREYFIDVPKGYDSVEDFCGQLNAYLTSLHNTKTQPLEQTLSGGTQTRGNLFDDSNPLIRSLIGEIEKCIRSYIEDTESFNGHLPVFNAAEDFHFSGSWSVRLEKNGFHGQHIHPMGWLSSAFYVELPKVIDDDLAKGGWLKIGAANLDVINEPVTERHIKPVVGKLVLFQSYMWHGTIPFDSEEARMTVAFDVAR